MPEWSEILVILVVATVVFGPHRLPAMARKAGKMMAEFRVAARELREGIEKELAVEEMREVAKDVMATTKEAGREVRESLAESEKSLRTTPALARPTDTAPGAERQGRADGDAGADADSGDPPPAPVPQESGGAASPGAPQVGSGPASPPDDPAPQTSDRDRPPDTPS